MGFIGRLESGLLGESRGRRFLYKLFSGDDFPDGAPYVMDRVPGYAWTWHPRYSDEWLDFLQTGVTGGGENEFGCSISVYRFLMPDGMLDGEPDGVVNPRTLGSDWSASSGWYYDHGTDVKPGWFYGDGSACVVTVPTKMVLYGCFDLTFGKCSFHDKLRHSKMLDDSLSRVR